MGILQDTYSTRQPAGYPGMPVDSEKSNDITRSNETAAGLAFGVPAVRGADTKRGCKAAAAAADKLLGVTLRNASIRPSAGDKYPQYGNTVIRTLGSVFVTIGATVAADDPVYWDIAAQKFTNAAAAGANLVMTGWKFDAPGVADDVVKIVRR